MKNIGKFYVIICLFLNGCWYLPNTIQTNTISQVYSSNPSSIKKNHIVNAPLDSINIIDINSQNLYGEYRTHYYYGISLALEELNQNGGINGIMLNLIKKDDHNSYIHGYRAAEEAGINSNPTVFLGSTSFIASLGVAQYAKDNKVPYLVTGSSSENILLENTDPDNPTIFRIKEGYLVHIKAIANNIAQSKDVTSVAIFTYENDEGDYLYNNLVIALQKAKPGIKVLGNFRTSKTIQSEGNFVDLRDTQATAVIVALDGPDVESFAMRMQRYKLLIDKRVYIMFAGEPEWLDNLGKYTPQGWVATGFPWYSINNLENTNFFKNYLTQYKLRPRYSSYIGYSTVYLLADALKKAGYGDKCKVNSADCRILLAKHLNQAQSSVPFAANTFINQGKTNLGTYIGILQQYNTTKTDNRRRIEKLDIRMFNSVFVGNK